MPNVRSALALSLVERYMLLALTVVGNMVLARLLTPGQIGVYSVSLAVIGLAQSLRDFGVGNYLIQERELTEDHVRTAFGVSLLLGLLLFVAALALAPVAARYYREPRMVLTLRLSALNFLLMPVCTVSLSLLRREMQFKRLLYIAGASSLLGTVVSIGGALAGFGENSLASGSVASNLVTGVGAWLARRERKLLLPGWSAWRSVLHFGGQSSLSSFVTSLSMDANDLVVGKVLGFHPVAMLSRAQGLMNLFHRDLMGAVRNVALPAFSAAHREGRQLSAPHAKSVALTLVFAWPFYGLVGIYGLEILDLLYGAQWHEAAPLVPLFCGAGALAAINALTPNLLVAVGRFDLATRIDLLLQPIRLLLIVLAASLFGSVRACAIAYLVWALASTPVFWWAKRRSVEDDGPLLRRYLRSTLLVTAATLLPALLHASWLGWSREVPAPPWQWLAVCAAGVCCGMVAVQWCAHPLAQEPSFRRLSALLHRGTPRPVA